MEEVRKGISRAVEELEALKMIYKNLKMHYFSLLDQYQSSQEQLEYGINLGREMYQGCLYYKEGYTALLNWIYNWNAAASEITDPVNPMLFSLFKYR